jgi:uncharacterized RDD family membrane protein YckC
MADQHGSGPLTPGDPLQGGGTPPGRPGSPPSEPLREPEPGESGGIGGPPLDPPREHDAPDGSPAEPPSVPEQEAPAGPPPAAPAAPREREWLGGSPAERPPVRERERSAPPIAPPAPEEPAGRPGSFAPPGYGTSPVPPGAFAPPAAAGARGPWVLAEWWCRAVAAVIDGVIVTVVALILLIPLAVVGLSVDTGGGGLAFGAGALVFTLLLVVAGFLYAPLLMARTNGQTVGKMAVDIRVVRANGRRMEFGWAFLREVVVKGLVFGVLLSSFTFGLASLLNYLWPLWDSENRALHDLLVDTRVIRA